MFAGIGGSIQKDFVDPTMRSPMLVAGGEAVAGVVAVARERGIFVVPAVAGGEAVARLR